jgi:short-subunit dehydrogenase
LDRFTGEYQMAVSLKDKVVLITGASSGFGASAAELFAREGAAVILAARRIDRLQDLAGKIQAQGGEAIAVPVDISEQAEIDNLVQTVLDIYDRIDILFNNAGFGRLDFLENLTTRRDIEMQVTINLVGTIQVTRAVLPYMFRRRQGHIINMSSVAGYIGAPSYTIYAATKYGVRGFTESLRREVSPFGIKVSGIYPGPAATEFGQHTGSSGFKKKLRIPAWTTMTSESVAQKVIQVAKHPRRTVIMPWWFQPIIWVNYLFPAVVDWVIRKKFTDKFHHPDIYPPAANEKATQPSPGNESPTVPPES